MGCEKWVGPNTERFIQGKPIGLSAGVGVRAGHNGVQCRTVSLFCLDLKPPDRMLASNLVQ